ncbi:MULTISPECIES: hypothetical protein [Entomomonas]|uniref:Uncharacterized protein n=1 Tax=Entomomonas asaccharolytica TaxID=2785331 RepID=A0A974NHJ0_9GAMM|nr:MULTISPECIES: hypothetical protein [Entomomonas]QQP86861.1 hypothetical protein JHT90_06360 [Entomomonas asaccharolytica]UYZ83521.1 hypothetical protein MTZ49_13095 [Entomomonas sp. E2T0]
MNKFWQYSKKILTSVSGLCLLMLITALLISSIGTLLSGGIQQWQTVLNNAAWYFLIWRLVIYIVVGYFWYATIKIYHRKNNQEGVEKMHKLGWLAVIMIVLVEGSKLWGMINDY